MKLVSSTVILVACAFLLSCEEEVTAPSSPPMGAEEISKWLTEIIGTGLPDGAIDPSAEPTVEAFPSFHCGFYGTDETVQSLIKASPVLKAAFEAKQERTPEPGAPYLLTSWNPEGTKDTRIVKIEVIHLSQEKRRIDVHTLLIERLQLMPESAGAACRAGAINSGPDRRFGRC